MVTILDLDIGNLLSVANALRRVGAEVSIARTVEAAQDARILVLPGVGAFERASRRLHEHGFDSLVRRHALERGQPLIGICLGMQLLADRSFEHGEFAGLGLIPGEVVQLAAQPPRYRVPHVGWARVKSVKSSPMFPPSVDGQSFYHVHSYHLVCRDARDIAATFEFGGQDVVTAVHRANVFGVQFHPEKSQDAGLNLLHSLLAHVNGTRPMKSAA